MALPQGQRRSGSVVRWASKAPWGRRVAQRLGNATRTPDVDERGETRADMVFAEYLAARMLGFGKWVDLNLWFYEVLKLRGFLRH